MGRTQAWVARAIGVSPALIGRLERHELRDASAGHVEPTRPVLGLAVRVSTFPEGEPVRDSVQLRLVGALRDRMHASLVWRTEVALPIPGDRRAWDAVAIGHDAWTAFEGISRLGVVDATLRRVNQKHRDDPRIGRVILVLADTVRNRRTLADAAATIRPDYPLDTRVVLGALASGSRRAERSRHPARPPPRRHPSTACPHRWDSRGRLAARNPEVGGQPGWCRAARPGISSCPNGPMEARERRRLPQDRSARQAAITSTSADARSRDHIKVLRSPVSSGISQGGGRGTSRWRPEGRDRIPVSVLPPGVEG